jgi:hypothetical protein
MNWSLPLRGIERVLIVLAGMLCIYLGYLLFVKGVSGKASLRVEFNKSKLQLANAMPGIFFALFGASILIFTIRQAVRLDLAIPSSSQQATPQFSALQKDAEELRKVLGLPSVKFELLEPADPCGKEKTEKYAIVSILAHGAPPDQSPTPSPTPKEK